MERLSDGGMWAGLHDPLLEDIISRLSLRDFIRSGAVCRRWRQVRKASNPAPQLPWLLLQPSDAVCPALHTLSDGRLSATTFTSPPPSTKPIRALVSSHGWIWMVEVEPDGYPSSRTFFFNPVSGATVEMPGPPAPFDRMDLHLALSAPPTDPNCTVVYWESGLATRRLHDPGAWKVHPLPGTCAYGLVVRDGKAYAFDSDQDGGDGTEVTAITVLDLPTDQLSLIKLDSRQFPRWWWDPELQKYDFLVDSPDGILLVLAFDNNIDNSDVYLPPDYKIEVFKADMQAMAWVRVERLNDSVVFVGKLGCYSVSASKARVMGNGVCLVHPGCWSYGEEWGQSWGHRWCWLEYSLEDGRILYHRVRDATEFTDTEPLLWMIPSLS